MSAAEASGNSARSHSPTVAGTGSPDRVWVWWPPGARSRFAEIP